MKKVIAGVVALGAVVMFAVPAQADTYTDTWYWRQHTVAIRTTIWEESVFDLGKCEDVNGPPTDPEVY